MTSSPPGTGIWRPLRRWAPRRSTRARRARCRPPSERSRSRDPRWPPRAQPARRCGRPPLRRSAGAAGPGLPGQQPATNATAASARAMAASVSSAVRPSTLAITSPVASRHPRTDLCSWRAVLPNRAPRRPGTAGAAARQVQCGAVPQPATTAGRAVQPGQGLRHPGRVPGRARVHRVGRPAPHLRRSRRPLAPPRLLPPRPGPAGAPPSATELAGHESGQDHVGPVPLQRQRVPRGDARLVPGPGRPLQRQLPLRGRGAALPARRRQAAGPDPPLLPRPTLAEVLPELAAASRCSSRWPTSRATPLLARGGALRGGPGRGLDPDGAPVDPSPDDLYILYTGGTTGMPKGVLWRQHDIFMAAMGGRKVGTWEIVDELRGHHRAAGRDAHRCELILLPPLMHGAAQWAAFILMAEGATMVFPDDPRRVDPDDVWSHRRAGAGQRHDASWATPCCGLSSTSSTGSSYDLSSLFAVGNGGAPLTPAVRAMATRAAAQPGDLRLGRLLGDRGADARRPRSTSVEVGHLPARARHRRRGRVADARARAGTRGQRVAGPDRERAARLPGRRREDGAHLPGDRRRPLLDPRRPGPPPGRRARSSCWAATR